MKVQNKVGVRDREKARPRAGEDEIRFVIGESTLGLVMVATSARGVCSVMLGDERDPLHRELVIQFPDAALIQGGPEAEAVSKDIIAYLESPTKHLNMSLDLRGTDFQRRVWKALREIPVGETVSYTELADRVGRPRAVRAVARACAANSLAVVIPCHRVVRRDGSLSGYRWGTERKRALLVREGMG